MFYCCKVRVTVVQPRYLGDLRDERVLERNLSIVKRVIDEEPESTIYVFPELFLGKYTNERLSDLQRLVNNKYLITGGVFYDDGLRNASFIISRGMVRKHYKVYLWADEGEIFRKGVSFKIYKINNLRVVLFICADFANPLFEPFIYNKQVLDELFMGREKPDLIIINSFAVKKYIRNKWLLAIKNASEHYQTRIIFSNYKGGVKSGESFYGGGYSTCYVSGLKKKGVMVRRKNYDYFNLVIK